MSLSTFLLFVISWLPDLLGRKAWTDIANWLVKPWLWEDIWKSWHSKWVSGYKPTWLHSKVKHPANKAANNIVEIIQNIFYQFKKIYDSIVQY
jgi:hypothetical protein